MSQRFVWKRYGTLGVLLTLMSLLFELFGFELSGFELLGFELSRFELSRFELYAGKKAIAQSQSIPGNLPPEVEIPTDRSLPMPPPITPKTPLPSDLLPPPEDLLQLPSSPPNDLPPDANPTQTLTVRRFNIVGSSVFSDAELEAVTQPFLNRPLTFSDLLKVRTAITQLYLDRGYVTSGAYIPANQTIQDGVVTIAILEGTLAEIRIIGTKSLRQQYIRDRLKPSSQKPLNVNKLVKSLQRLKQDPLLERISAEILPGRAPGTNMLDVKVTQAPDRDLRVLINNQRSPSSGELARQVSYSQTNLTGYGDRIYASYTNTDGSNEFSLGYTIPFNASNGTVSLNYGQSFSRVIQQPFKDLELQSQSRNLSISVRQPILDQPTQQFILGFALSRQESETTLFGIPYQFPLSGADEKGHTRITELSFSQEWNRSTPRSLFTLRSDFGIGLDLLGATVDPENFETTVPTDKAPDGQYLKWQGQAQWIYALNPDVQITLRSTLQLADRPLPSQGLISLSGTDAIRGYPEDLFMFDQAALGTAEASIAIYRSPGRSHTLYLIPFLDVGYGWNNLKPSSTKDRVLLSPGLGVRYEWSDRLSVTLNWAIPLIGVPNENIVPSLNNSRVTFTVDAKLF